MRSILLTEESYNKTFRGLFKEHAIDSQYILQTKIDLPFEIPVPDGYVVLSQLDNEDYWSILYFSSTEYREKIKVFDNESHVDSRKTVVGLCIAGKEFILDAYEAQDTPFNLSNKHSYFFDSSLSHLNAVITAYLVHFQDENVFELTKYDLSPVCSYELVRTSDWQKDSIVFVLHHSIDVPKTMLTTRDKQIE